MENLWQMKMVVCHERVNSLTSSNMLRARIIQASWLWLALQRTLSISSLEFLGSFRSLLLSLSYHFTANTLNFSSDSLFLSTSRSYSLFHSVSLSSSLILLRFLSFPFFFADFLSFPSFPFLVHWFPLISFVSLSSSLIFYYLLFSLLLHPYILHCFLLFYSFLSFFFLPVCATRFPLALVLSPFHYSLCPISFASYHIPS